MGIGQNCYIQLGIYKFHMMFTKHVPFGFYLSYQTGPCGKKNSHYKREWLKKVFTHERARHEREKGTEKNQ